MIVSDVLETIFMIVFDVLETLFDDLTQVNLSYVFGCLHWINYYILHSGEPVLRLPVLFSPLVWHRVPQSSVP